MWFVALLAGNTAAYACRTTMPLVSPVIAKDLSWSKTEAGTVLSSFFWGYALTQILGGYLSDRFGAERVLLGSVLGWGLLTFWFHQIVYFSQDHDSAIALIVFSRVMMGAFQGVHYPAVASITSRNLGARDRSVFFSATCAGSPLGALLTGTVGSYVNGSFGWPAVFYTIGFFALAWAAFLRYHAMALSRRKRLVAGVGDARLPLLGPAAAAGAAEEKVPWLTYLSSRALWACIVGHFCQNNCFFILLSWLPTYFHDNFPEAPSSVFNVVPWAFNVPGIFLASYFVKRLLARGSAVGTARKISESICLGTEAACLMLIGHTSGFPAALTLMSVCLLAQGFHNSGTTPNPQDLAPKHSGTVFGVMNGIGCIPGFVGVYLAGYILEVTGGSWIAVFNVTAAINAVGLAVFVAFGSGNPIV